MTLKIRALIRTRTRPVSPILGMKPMKLHFVFGKPQNPRPKSWNQMYTYGHSVFTSSKLKTDVKK